MTPTIFIIAMRTQNPVVHRWFTKEKGKRCFFFLFVSFSTLPLSAFYFSFLLFFSTLYLALSTFSLSVLLLFFIISLDNFFKDHYKYYLYILNTYYCLPISFFSLQLLMTWQFCKQILRSVMNEKFIFYPCLCWPLLILSLYHFFPKLMYNSFAIAIAIAI